MPSGVRTALTSRTSITSCSSWAPDLLASPRLSLARRISPQRPDGLWPRPWERSFSSPSYRLFPLNRGWTISISQSVPSMSKHEKEPQFSFDVAFGQGEVVEGEPLVETLNDF